MEGNGIGHSGSAFRRGLRLVTTGVAGLIGSGFILGLVQSNVQEWAKANKQDQWLVDYWGPAMDRLAILSQSHWFIFLAGFAIGGAMYMWADYLIRMRSPLAQSTNDAISYQETVIRFERDRSSPHQFLRIQASSKNISASFQIWDFKPMVVFESYEKTGSIPVIIQERRATPTTGHHSPEQIDTFVVWFTTPIIYSQVKIEAFGQVFPRHEVYMANERGVVVYTRDPIPAALTTFEIGFKP